MRKAVQAKHIPTAEVLAFLATPSRYGLEPPVHLIWDVEEHFPEYPGKVVAAKMRAVIRNGLVDGCDCGCRGDFVLTDKGREALLTDGQSAPRIKPTPRS